MTHPLTPREKVSRTVYDTVTRFDGDTVGTHLGLSAMIDAAAPTVDDERRIVKSVCDDIADSVLTALASSGDHAELARSIGKAIDNNIRRTSRLYSVRTGERRYGVGGQAEATDAVMAIVSPLLAENAALREKVRTEIKLSVDNYVRATARSTEAERKLAEARSMLLRWRRHAPTEALEDLTDAWLSKEAERG